MWTPDSIEKETPLVQASTAEVYTWGVGHVLKLFHELTPGMQMRPPLQGFRTKQFHLFA